MQEIKVERKKRTASYNPRKSWVRQNFYRPHVCDGLRTKNGWHNARIKAVENLSIHPATMFIHYGQAIFEGIKAFKTVDGEPAIFRPENHIKGFNNSAKRLCMPEIDSEFFLNALQN